MTYVQLLWCMPSFFRSCSHHLYCTVFCGIALALYRPSISPPKEIALSSIDLLDNHQISKWTATRPKIHIFLALAYIQSAVHIQVRRVHLRTSPSRRRRCSSYPACRISGSGHPLYILLCQTSSQPEICGGNTYQSHCSCRAS